MVTVARTTQKLLAAEVDPAPLALVVLGSFARGEAGTDSDIDVLKPNSQNASVRTARCSYQDFSESPRAESNR